MLLRYLDDTNTINRLDFEELDKKIKKKQCQADIYVPSTEEVNATLSKLDGSQKQLYLLLLYSGIRISELEHILKRKDKVQVQKLNGISKVELNWARGSKMAFYVYLPTEMLPILNEKKTRLSSLIEHVKDQKLIPLKYCRKYFYTMAIDTGCPSEVADYIQGRVQSSVGGRHYLAVQRIADEWYPKIIQKLHCCLSK